MIRYTAHAPNIETGIVVEPKKRPRQKFAVRWHKENRTPRRTENEIEKQAQKLYAILCDAANAGRLCPTNKQLSKMIAANCEQTVTARMMRLRRSNRIKIHPLHKSRVIEIIATGKRTRLPAGKTLQQELPQ